MRIVEVTVGDLPDFVNSSEYLSLNIKPITPLRAVSQSKNPNASASDTALVYACENNSLLSFAGLLPAALNHNNGFAVSNSGWWVSPEKGKSLGLPLFMRAFNDCNRRMFFTDCSAYTKEILDKTGYFTFFPPIVGKRWFMRYYTGSMLMKRGYKKHTVNFARGVDSLLNTFALPLMQSYRKGECTEGFESYQCQKLDSSLAEFIGEHSGHYFLSQDIDKLNWMISHPWVTTWPGNDVIDYPFSYEVQSFSQHFLVIRKDGEIRAVLLISMRDNHVTLPFYYGSTRWINEIAGILKEHIIKLQANSLILFNEELIRAFDALKLPAYYAKNIVRYAGCSKGLEPFFPPGGFFQDGEADVVFT
jgi:hypothetical protein